MENKVTKASSDGTEQQQAAFRMNDTERPTSQGGQRRHRDWAFWEDGRWAQESLQPKVGAYLGLGNGSFGDERVG